MTIDTHAGALALRPTPKTLRLRRSILWQSWRFVVINLRMLVMILKSHDTRIQTTRSGRPRELLREH